VIEQLRSPAILSGFRGNPDLLKPKTQVTRENRIEPRIYDKVLFKARHLIENFFAKLKQYRAIATRYDKTARNFR